jgi:hypothetical protein
MGSTLPSWEMILAMRTVAVAVHQMKVTLDRMKAMEISDPNCCSSHLAVFPQTFRSRVSDINNNFLSNFFMNETRILMHRLSKEFLGDSNLRMSTYFLSKRNFYVGRIHASFAVPNLPWRSRNFLMICCLACTAEVVYALQLLAARTLDRNDGTAPMCAIPLASHHNEQLAGRFCVNTPVCDSVP